MRAQLSNAEVVPARRIDCQLNQLGNPRRAFRIVWLKVVFEQAP